MADWSAIRAALASQMDTASVRESSSTNFTIGMLPCVKVERISEIEIWEARGGRGAGFEYRLARIEGKLLVSSSKDLGRAQVDAEGIVEELFVAARTGLRLGFPGIVEDSWLDSASLGMQEFAGSELYGADLRWIVKVMETATRTS
jgi:hypothetical protein